MKAGTYTVRGVVGPSRTEPVAVNVYESQGAWFADFDYEGERYSYRPRLMSATPERLTPKRVLIGVQPTVTSIAREAFKAAKVAAQEDARATEIAARDAAQEDMSLDDIALGGIARRSMGVSQ